LIITSTFRYFLQLNRLSDGSFSSASHYPVFPWVWTDLSLFSSNLQNSFHCLNFTRSRDAAVGTNYLYGGERIQDLSHLSDCGEFKEFPLEFLYFPEVLFGSESMLPLSPARFEVFCLHHRVLESDHAIRGLHAWFDAVVG
jgi:hypothetical protein